MSVPYVVSMSDCSNSRISNPTLDVGCKPDIVRVAAKNLGDHGEDSTFGAGARGEEKPKFLREVKHVLVNITLVAVYFLETYDRSMFGKLDEFRDLFVSFFVISSKKGSAVPGQ